MKIALLGPGWPWRGGISRFQTKLAQELALQHSVKIFSFQQQYPRLIFPGQAQKDFSQPNPGLDSADVLVPYNPFSWRAAARKIAAWQPDLLIISYWIPFFAPAFGWLARRLSKQTKIFYLTHNLEFHEKWLLAEKFTDYALLPATKIITLSRQVFAFAQAKYPSKEVVEAFHPSYDSYDQHNFSRDLVRQELALQDKEVLLFFGYIKPYKGLDLLLAALPEIIQQKPNIHLLIVGEIYGDEKKYFAQIQQLQLADHISFINKFVPEIEVEKYFKAADLLVLPYKTATQSGVANIAYAMKLGVVCTPVGGLPEIVIDGKTGSVAADLSAAALAQAVFDFDLIDPAELQQNIQQQLAQHSWAELARLILE
ncbi:MAG: glycosyltransferase [Candidatus Cloacimonadales bacterium]